MTSTATTVFPTWEHERAVLAHRTRELGRDHPQVDEARRDFKAARLAAHIAKIVDAAPPLTAEQRDRLATLLRPSVTP